MTSTAKHDLNSNIGDIFTLSPILAFNPTDDSDNVSESKSSYGKFHIMECHTIVIRSLFRSKVRLLCT